MAWTPEEAKQMSEKAREMSEKAKERLNSKESIEKRAKSNIENNRKRKLFKETINTLLSKQLKRGELCTADDVLSMAEMEDKNVDVQTAILIAVTQRAMMGDMTAVQFLRDTVGEKPSDKVEVDSNLSIETWAKKHKVKL